MNTYETKTTNRSFSAPAYRIFAFAALAAIASCSLATAAGEDTFKSKCAGCHGPDGSGNTAMGKKFKLRDLRSADVQKQSEAELTAIVTNGKPPMPAFGKSLDAPAIQALVAYMRTIATK
jgi:mono/diheme cytochrome c family protein